MQGHVDAVGGLDKHLWIHRDVDRPAPDRRILRRLGELEVVPLGVVDERGHLREVARIVGRPRRDRRDTSTRGDVHLGDQRRDLIGALRVEDLERRGVREVSLHACVAAAGGPELVADVEVVVLGPESQRVLERERARREEDRRDVRRRLVRALIDRRVADDRVGRGLRRGETLDPGAPGWQRRGHLPARDRQVGPVEPELALRRRARAREGDCRALRAGHRVGGRRQRSEARAAAGRVEVPERESVERRLLHHLLVVDVVRARVREVLLQRVHPLLADRARVGMEVLREEREQALGERDRLAVAVAVAGVRDVHRRLVARVELRPVEELPGRRRRPAGQRVGDIEAAVTAHGEEDAGGEAEVRARRTAR